MPGRHLSVNGLVRQLNTHGIQARIGRSAALINLATDLPAAVLADLLGMHINTAVRWVKRARRDWASYLAARWPPAPKPPAQARPGIWQKWAAGLGARRPLAFPRSSPSDLPELVKD